MDPPPSCSTPPPRPFPLATAASHAMLPALPFLRHFLGVYHTLPLYPWSTAKLVSFDSIFLNTNSSSRFSHYNPLHPLHHNDLDGISHKTLQHHLLARNAPHWNVPPRCLGNSDVLSIEGASSSWRSADGLVFVCLESGFTWLLVLCIVFLLLFTPQFIP